MSELKDFLTEHKSKNKSSGLTNLLTSTASVEDSDKAGLLSWVPSTSSVSISMPDIFNKGSDTSEGSEASSSWFNEAKQDPICPSMSRKQRLIGFASCICGGIFCFSFASIYLPVLLLKARKFALLYSLGSLFMLNSFSFLWGPWIHMKHLFTAKRLPFTSAYFLSLFGTLYCAMYLKSTILTSIAALIQVLALTWYIVSYIPGGQTGLMFISKMFTKLVARTCSRSMS